MALKPPPVPPSEKILESETMPPAPAGDVKPPKPLSAPKIITALAIPASSQHGTIKLDIVRPMVTAEDALANWNEIQKVKKALLVDNSEVDGGKTGDIAKMKNGSKATKKSGWRKLAAVFNLSDEIISQTREILGKDEFLWRVIVKITAPNGRFTTGEGTCSTTERKEGRVFGHLENDVIATAHTRAKNRGISDLIGGGEVSAEELKE